MTTKYKRRTFAAVEADGYAKGREEARKEFEDAYNLLSKHSSSVELENAMLQRRLDNVSLRQLAWSRITALFKGRP